MHELLIRLSAGNDVVNEVIVHEMSLAQKLAHKYRILFPYKKYDITSVALLALVRGVHELCGEVPAEDIEKFLNTRIRTAIITYLSKDKLIPIPRGSQYDATQHGEPIIPSKIFRIDSESTDAESGHHTGSTYEISDTTYCEMMAGIELREHFDCVLNEQEKQILEDRLRGLSQTEIAIGWGCTPQYIGQILKQIRKKCYGISIHKERENLLQGCRILQLSENTSEEVISTEPVCGACAT